MFEKAVTLLIFVMSFHWTACLIPPKFQWKTIDFAWEGGTREKAIADGSYIPENVMPTGLARWQDKIFITIPRWKKGVPASLNYILLNGTQQQPLTPYPSWHDAFVSDKACCATTNSTVVSAFRVTVDNSDRLWVVDNGVADMASEVRQIAEPAILVFDLKTNRLIHKYVFSDDELKDSSVLTSIKETADAKAITGALDNKLDGEEEKKRSANAYTMSRSFRIINLLQQVSL